MEVWRTEDMSEDVRTIRSVAILVALLTLLLTTAAPAQMGTEREMRILNLKSKIFNNTRKLRILLPPDYSEPSSAKRRYPVLYLNDGQDLFDAESSMFTGKEWQVDETVYDLIGKGEIVPIIVVGIDNPGKRMRPDEYLPWEDKYLSPPMPEPHGSQFPEFLEKEVVPLIEKNFRVSPVRLNRALGGSSYGGLITLYSAIKKPDLFGKLLIESPSFYVNDAKVLDLAGTWSTLPLKVYLGVGTNELGKKDCAQDDDNREAVTDVRRLEKILEEKGLNGSRLKVNVDRCAVHNEDAWAKRLPGALKFLFPAK